MPIHQKEEHTILQKIQRITGYPLEASTGGSSELMKMEQSG